MKAAGIKVGEIYEVERYLGSSWPLRVTRIERDKARKVGYSLIPVDNGTLRVYGLRLDRDTLEPVDTKEEGFVLGKVLAPWDAARYAKEKAAAAVYAKQRHAALHAALDAAKELAGKLAGFGVRASVTSEGGLSINAASVPELARRINFDAALAALDKAGEEEGPP